MEIHLTKKNVWIWILGVSVVLLTAIGISIPSAQWFLPPWKWIILALAGLAILGLTMQLLVQFKEDHSREEKERQRDQRQEGIELKLTEITQLVSRGSQRSLSPESLTGSEAKLIGPPVNFDAAAYFRLSHQSAWTADVEQRIKIAAAQAAPVYGLEGFYAKFIGVGLVSYMHDIVWAYIWRSQFLMMTDLNRSNGIMPLGSARKFYDQGVVDFPNNYTNYTFDQWLLFLQSNGLIIRHPSEMLEITVRGRDFLVYSAHNSRAATDRKG